MIQRERSRDFAKVCRLHTFAHLVAVVVANVPPDLGVELIREEGGDAAHDRNHTEGKGVRGGRKVCEVVCACVHV